MPVAINADPSELMFEGSFDPVIAEEKGVEYTVTCDECGRQRCGTTFDLSEHKWEWNIRIDNKREVQMGGKALCGYCNEDVEDSEIGPADKETEQEEDLEPWEKAISHPDQKTLGDLQ